MQKNYTKIFSAIHWIHAAILIFILIAATINLPDLPAKGEDLSPFKGHIIFGLVATVFTIIRLLVLLKQPKLEPLNMDAFRETIVRWNHRFIYIFLLLTGLSGIATAKSTNLGDAIVFANDPMAYGGPDGITDILATIHSFSSYTLAALVAMHIAGTILYIIKSKENILKRVGFGKGE